MVAQAARRIRVKEATVKASNHTQDMDHKLDLVGKVGKATAPVLHQVDMDSKPGMEDLHKAITADLATMTTINTTRYESLQPNMTRKNIIH